MQINISKNEFQEIVVRKALYWMTEKTTWTLKETQDNFIIDFAPIEKLTDLQIEQQFSILLNDFYLRNLLNKNNKHLREKIIEQALIKVYQHNV
ncbi:MAG: His-Xaa-Ser system protein HxsD [Sulfurovum sp.]|nr:His-Xaa-Ser system protein HxsD [Sulfurovum sp.]MCB4764134.1 His-Xaa-Ser system protein HxsD [Sulfurovum sp.]MCB4766509.1 His-Xaa-Ser system protein HxsD [Sulfurovum sp.]MCB4773276.1 His-Xaa-Ser system protein HxsD [Sulfurovum sp.]MCB4774004.1 His-Xaa-Ser system protein HxsD [Sulfurovum sp.]